MPFFREQPELLLRFHRGDEAVLEEVYRFFVGRVETAARHGGYFARSGKRVPGLANDEVEDVVHETFARAFADRARRAYDGKQSYGPYLAAIVRNLLVDEARRRGRELVMDELVELPVEVDDEPEWADEETVRAVEDYLLTLPGELRAVHQQRYQRGASQEETARALGLSRQQVRTIEQRLRDGLSQHLEKIASQKRVERVGKGRALSNAGE